MTQLFCLMANKNQIVTSFINVATERLKKEIPENELWERFKVQYKDLFLNFLHTEALRKEYERNLVLSTRISDLPVSLRPKNALEGWIYDVGELIQCSEKYLLGFRGIGEESVKEICGMSRFNGIETEVRRRERRCHCPESDEEGKKRSPRRMTYALGFILLRRRGGW